VIYQTSLYYSGYHELHFIMGGPLRMRSAIYFPDAKIHSEKTMCAALLMWDEIKVIAPWQEYKPTYQRQSMAEAWELIGGTMRPDQAQQQKAHESITQLLESKTNIDVTYQDANRPFEVWPSLMPETFHLLLQKGMTSGPLANGDYPFGEPEAFAVLGKLADACAGDVFARWTDRFLSYGLVGDRDPEAALQTTVVPLTLNMLDPESIPIQSLIDFRKREQSEGRGSDYREMRHRYADSLQKHVEATKTVASENQLTELRREFEEDTRRDLKELERALGSNLLQKLTAPIVVSSIVAAGSWLAIHNLHAALAALAASGWASIAIEKATAALRWQNEFGTKQREILAKHPMAYLYQIQKAV
jgi:hypothetical protein